MYEYRAEYLSNYDGDTITFMIDLGFKTFQKVRVRLSKVDTEEIRNMKDSVAEKIELGFKAKNFVQEALSTAEMITIQTIKDKTGSFGRYLADVLYIPKGTNQEVSLSKVLLNEGLAVEYKR